MPELLMEVTSPVWAYLALLGLLVLDAFIPVVPTQAVMITGGALTVYGGLSLPVTIAVGALGVFTGDLACYLLGRSTHQRRERREQQGHRRRRHVSPGLASRAAGRVTRRFLRPGPLVILLCRFVPGGRMAACFSAGRSQYPYRLFLVYEATAALGWAAYGALVGHIGGAALTGSVWLLALVAAGAAGGFTLIGWMMNRYAVRAPAEAE